MNALLHASLLLACGAGDGAPIHWGERELELAALPPELPAGARSALEAWHGWSSAGEYRLDLDRTGRVLLVSRRDNGRVARQLELAGAVLERFDRELPAPAQRLAAKPPPLVPRGTKPPKPKPDHVPLPEDPEEPEGDHPWTLEPSQPQGIPAAPPVVTKWGSQDVPLDTQTVVLFVVRHQADFEQLLAHLAAQFPYLVRWTREAKALQGFVLGDPCAGAYLELPDGVEEWDPDHELVNRLGRLCLLNRYGELANWFVQGYAWHLEIALQGSVYCFPWRDEFVWATEHGGWPKAVANRYERADVAPADFMGWRRGKYDDAMAKASWGMTEYLLAQEAERLPGLLDELRVFREEHGRVQDDPATWRRDVDYEIPVKDQQELFVKHLGPEYLERATAFLRHEIDPEAE
jgi:hypothetical protein